MKIFTILKQKLFILKVAPFPLTHFKHQFTEIQHQLFSACHPVSKLLEPDSMRWDK